jgi:small subunit ribosomal protein S20
LAEHKSAIKRSKQNEKRRLRNATVKSQVKTEMKKILSMVEAKDSEGARVALKDAIPTIAKAGLKRVYHKKNASRKISRLMRNVNTLASK